MDIEKGIIIMCYANRLLLAQCSRSTNQKVMKLKILVAGMPSCSFKRGTEHEDGTL